MSPTPTPKDLRVRDKWTREREAAVWGRVVRAQKEQEKTRTAGVVLGFFCLAAFTALGVFGLVRSRTAIISLAGDEAPDDEQATRGPGRFAPGVVAGADDEAAADAAPSPGAAAGNDLAPDGAAVDSSAGRATSRRKLRFRDGSVAVLRSAETVLEPVSVDSRRIVSVLRAGAARFEITKRPGRLFRVVAGAAIVEVLGTKFELERIGSRLRVDVTEGRVRVSWAGGERRLGPGESGLFPPEPAARRRVPAETADGAAPSGSREPAPEASAASQPRRGEPRSGARPGSMSE